VIGLTLFHDKPTASPGVVSVAFLGSTNLATGSRLGEGTPEFPTFDPAVLGITIAPPSKRVALFLLTNGTSQNAYCNLAGIELFQDGNWVAQPWEWPAFGWELAPGKSCIQPVPDPGTNFRWRIRLGVQERGRGMKEILDRTTSKYFQTIVYPGKSYQVFSGSIMNGRGEPDGPANRSQPIRAETNRTSAAAGSDR
jgi:hypothetical protein